MAKKKDKYNFDDIQRLGDEKREAYMLVLQDIYPDHTVKIKGKEVNIGKICRKWYQIIHDYCPNPKDPVLPGLILIIDMAEKKCINLDDKTTKYGQYWSMLIKHYFKLGQRYRETMDSTGDELTRLLTRR